MSALRSLRRGLVEPAKANTLIADAAKRGSTAEEGTGDDRPYAGGIAEPSADVGPRLRRVLGFVHDD